MLHLRLFKLHLVLLDSHVHQFELLSLLVLESFVVAAAWHASLQDCDRLLKLLLFVPHLIDAFDKVDVVFHEPGVVLAVLLQVA